MNKNLLSISGPVLITVLLGLLVFSGCAGKQKDIEKSQILYRMAIDLDTKGDSTQALAQALEAEKLNPNDSEIQNLLGIFFLRNQMYDRSEKHFKKALALDKDYSEARVNLSYLYIEKGLFEEAIAEGLQAVENILYASPERAYNNIGWAYYKMGDLKNAMAFFNKALLHNKNFFLAHKNIATIYMETGNYKEAKKAYEASIKGCETCADLYYELGMTLLKLKDKKGAVRMFEECRNRSKVEEFTDKCAKKIAVLK